MDDGRTTTGRREDDKRTTAARQEDDGRTTKERLGRRREDDGTTNGQHIFSGMSIASNTDWLNHRDSLSANVKLLQGPDV